MLWDSVPDSVREDIYDVVEACINRGVSISDFRRVVSQAWPELLREKARVEMEIQSWAV